MNTSSSANNSLLVYVDPSSGISVGAVGSQGAYLSGASTWGLPVFVPAAPPPNIIRQLFSNVSWSVSCPNCGSLVNGISLPKGREPLTCKACDRKYTGELSIHSVTIAGDQVAFEVHEGTCSCGCHNSSRVQFRGHCAECKTEFENYLTKVWDDAFYNTSVTVTTTGSGAHWTYAPNQYSTTTGSIAYTTTASTGTFNNP